MADESEAVDPVQEPTQHTVEDWRVATALLAHLLKSHNGCVSSVALRKELERKGINDARGLVIKMKFHDFDAPPRNDFPAPEEPWRHHGKSFYSVDAYKAALAETKTEADVAAAAEPVVEPDDEAPVAVRRSNKQEEARLVTYVRDALTDIYASEWGPPERECVFDVHNQRAGTDYENVDVIAIHWRSDEIIDVVSVEVKLEFSSRLIQQANNYRRFSHRVWIAVPVQAEFTQAAVELRERDSRLFDYIVDIGIGILACHKRPGRSYEVVPIQWPRHITPEPIEREALIARHRQTFEDAGVVAPQTRGSYPKLR